MLEELHRRNFADTTIRTYLHGVTHFSQYFRRSPDQLGPEHIRKYQAMLFTKMKFSPNSFLEGIVREKALYYSCRRDLRMAGREEREKAEI
jgi:hypothetical protein